MMGNRVFFYDPDETTGDPARRAIAAAGCEATVVHEPSLLGDLDPAAHDLVVLTLDEGLRPHQAAIMERVRAVHPRTRLVLRPCHGEPTCIELMAREPTLDHVIARRDDLLDTQEIIACIAKLRRGEVFGLERYLPWGVEIHRLEVGDSRDKAQYVREVSALANRLGCPERMVELVETVVDELSTNAIFNAPRDARGEPRFAHLNRREAVTLEPAERGRLDFAYDGRHFVIAQQDPFGALCRQTVLTYLERCLVQTPDRQPGAGGAGMGLFRVYRALSKLVFNVCPGVRTEIIGFIDLEQSFKRFRTQPKSLHFFTQEGAP